MTGKLIVAIDGPSGVGKTTVARGVAQRLGVPYFETGAMYRAVGWKLLQLGIDPEDREAAERVAAELDLGFRLGEAGKMEVLLDGAPVGEEIRTPEVSEATSRSAVHPGVRRRLVELQRQWAGECGAVMEGRDIGTRVFPGTPYKFFLEAPEEVRIERRLGQLRRAGGRGLSHRQLEAELTERDRRDRRRPTSPLTYDESYVALDTAHLSAEEVIDRIVERVGAAGGVSAGC
ncbi:MAG: (d)CMP kinase [Thermoanaerobaculia bacterium]|nr:(d)CMP kinase [Thermoanaerobaculia bacterium]